MNLITAADYKAWVLQLKGAPKVFVKEELGQVTIMFHSQHSRKFIPRKIGRFTMMGVKHIFKQVSHAKLRELTGKEQFAFKPMEVPDGGLDCNSTENR